MASVSYHQQQQQQGHPQHPPPSHQPPPSQQPMSATQQNRPFPTPMQTYNKPMRSNTSRSITGGIQHTNSFEQNARDFPRAIEKIQTLRNILWSKGEDPTELQQALPDSSGKRWVFGIEASAYEAIFNAIMTPKSPDDVYIRKALLVPGWTYRTVGADLRLECRDEQTEISLSANIEWSNVIPPLPQALIAEAFRMQCLQSLTKRKSQASSQEYLFVDFEFMVVDKLIGPAYTTTFQNMVAYLKQYCAERLADANGVTANPKPERIVKEYPCNGHNYHRFDIGLPLPGALGTTDNSVYMTIVLHKVRPPQNPPPPLLPGWSFSDNVNPSQRFPPAATPQPINSFSTPPPLPPPVMAMPPNHINSAPADYSQGRAPPAVPQTSYQNGVPQHQNRDGNMQPGYSGSTNGPPPPSSQALQMTQGGLFSVTNVAGNASGMHGHDAQVEEKRRLAEAEEYWRRTNPRQQQKPGRFHVPSSLNLPWKR